MPSQPPPRQVLRGDNCHPKRHLLHHPSLTRTSPWPLADKEFGVLAATCAMSSRSKSITGRGVGPGVLHVPFSTLCRHPIGLGGFWRQPNNTEGQDGTHACPPPPPPPHAHTAGQEHNLLPLSSLSPSRLPITTSEKTYLYMRGSTRVCSSQVEMEEDGYPSRDPLVIKG